jgi:hypothetical protein
MNPEVHRLWNLPPMPRFPRFLVGLLALSIYGKLSAAQVPLTWGDDLWQLQTDPDTGALVHLENRSDPQHMNWLREPGKWDHRTWVPSAPSESGSSGEQWGLIELAKVGILHSSQVHKLSDRAWETVYEGPSLSVTVHRELDAADELAESYTFRNTGTVALDLPLGALAITAPFFDQYPEASTSLSKRCHTHIWMGGNSAWINAMRMGTEPPHLGLVATGGSLDAYSQRGGAINDRGVFLLHPAAMKIAPGESQTISWKLFWHRGWDDFFARIKATDGFIQLTAKTYTVTVGQPLEITAESAISLKSAQLLANGQPVKFQLEKGVLRAALPTSKIGEVLVEVSNNGKKTWLRANVIASPDDLLAARIKFIITRQQRNAPGNALDGAYLIYDNETGQQVYQARPSDHNAGRERLAMGVLGALYLPLCRDESLKAQLTDSLTRYSTFIERELEDDSGVIYSDIGRQRPERLYNFPWVAQFHLAMYQATGDTDQLDRFVRVLRNYYAHGGAAFYCIGLPITDGLKSLADAGRTKDREELLADFRTHADHLVKNGPNYPTSEVNYEQSIVAPGVQIITEMYLATGDKTYLEAAKQQILLLQAFCGKQPDFRLNGVAIRHWDDYWFGKLKLYGDTFPQYWSSLNALVYAYYGRASDDSSWYLRGNAVLEANLSLFKADGSASCAHIYPLTENMTAAAKDDPWANDQDWTMVHLLMVRSIEKSGK